LRRGASALRLRPAEEQEGPHGPEQPRQHVLHELRAAVPDPHARAAEVLPHLQPRVHLQ
ncbi:unnamed protein product, partial [Prorocentrum cordatum]